MSFENAFHYPERYGFTHVTDACIDSGDSCDTYLLFDPFHPSTRMHEYLGQEAIAYLDKAGVFLDSR
ncbi:MAG: hypothetical protein P1U61_07455 [Legionellaceae bacterium]|nr:hypothetical protein [Legionellaceae bacterium]